MKQNQSTATDQKPPAVRWAGAVLMNDAGQLLLNLRDNRPGELSYPNQWDLIGGVVEDGGSPDDCMVREMEEETGETAVIFHAFHCYEVPLAGGARAEYHVYSGRLNKPASELFLGEGQEHRFFSPPALASLKIVPWTKRVLDDFLDSGHYTY